MEQALCNFKWELTEEGFSYWLKVQRNVREGLYERTDWNVEVDLMQEWFAAYVEMLVIEKLETRNPLQIVREYQETGMLFLHNGFKAMSFSDWKINQIAGQTIYL